MTIRFQDPNNWDRLTTVHDDREEYEYADSGMSHFMCPTQWIKKNFIPLSSYALPHINTLSEIAKYKSGYTS